MATGGALAALAALALFRGDGRTVVTLLAVFGVLVSLDAQRRWPRWARGLLIAAYALAVLPFVSAILEAVSYNLRFAPEWDFRGFWLHARSAVEGRNFYDPETLQQATAHMTLTDEFRTEIVDVGFWYPPPSMFFLFPLGWFETPTAALEFWYVVQVATLALAIFLMWRLFLPGSGAVGLVACVVLAITCHGTFHTFLYGQTNFIALAALLLFWRRRQAAGGGAWAAAALFAKPFLAVLGLWALLVPRRRALAGLLATVAALLLASVAVFGPRTFADYFVGDHLGAKPDWIYSQPTNQSLLGWVLRVTAAECSGAQCVANPWFVAGAALLGAASLALAWALRRSAHDEWSLALLVVCVLLVYPVSQLFYSVLLVPVLLLGWRERERLAGGAATVALVAGTTYALCAADNGRRTVAAFALVWIWLALVCLARVRGRGWPLRRGLQEG